MPAHTWIELGNGKAAEASSERAWTLGPTRYADHDAFIGLSAAVIAGDRPGADRWISRLSYGSTLTDGVAAALGDAAALERLRPSQTDTKDILAAVAAERLGKIDEAAADLRSAIDAQRARFDTEYAPLLEADERLGALYVRAQRYTDAETAFRDVLARRPYSPRALFGLSQALRGEGHTDDAAAAEAQYASLWAGTTLTVNDF